MEETVREKRKCQGRRRGEERKGVGGKPGLRKLNAQLSCSCSRLLLSYLGKLRPAALTHTVKVVHLLQLSLPLLSRVQEVGVVDEQLGNVASNIMWSYEKNYNRQDEKSIEME